MTKMNQKEATFAAICEVTGFNGEGKFSITPEQRKMVNMILFEGFRAEKIELSADCKVHSDKDLKSYVSGLQSNWIRKDKRLNGGIVYTAKNPGSRAGSGDPALKSLKALLSTLTKPEDKEEVQGYIDARVAEIAATKTAVEVNFDAIPEALKKFQK